MYGLSDSEIYGDQFDSEVPLPFPSGGPDEPDPTPPDGPVAGVAVVIRAPRGPVAAKPGFAVYAVVEETDPETGEPEVVAGEVLCAHLNKLQSGEVLAHAYSLTPEKLAVPATAVICNDGAGKTHARYPVLRVAA